MNNYSFNFTGKTILVTGASSGIGKEVAIASAKAGANVILTGRDQKRLYETLNLMEAGEHYILAGDFQDENYILKLCKELPQLDGVVYSAGLIKLIPLNFIKSIDIEQMFGINLKAPILLISLLNKLKKLNRHSSIVLLSSITSSSMGSMANSVYGASKGGLEGFCKSAALELVKKNIRINCIAPGMVETEGIDSITMEVSNDSIELDKKNYPMGRYGKVSEIAAACLFLLSDGSSWTTGSTIVIDGGFTAK